MYYEWHLISCKNIEWMMNILFKLVNSGGENLRHSIKRKRNKSIETARAFASHCHCYYPSEEQCSDNLEQDKIKEDGYDGCQQPSPRCSRGSYKTEAKQVKRNESGEHDEQGKATPPIAEYFPSELIVRFY